jgi:Fic family protein
MIPYQHPRHWIRYDGQAITNALADAKATIKALQTIPYQKQWVDRLQAVELKREVAGTSRIEGADFTERELDEAMRDEPGDLITRSQRQAHAAVRTYRWIAELPDDRPIDAALIRGIHGRIVSGADDDHCPPGTLRTADQNVTFGSPRHRGAEGGQEVATAFEKLVAAMQGEFRDHDPIVQAMAAHYHIAAMHPFLDGNGRTARALEALMLQRAGLRHTAFIAMSNYYYDEKHGYLAALAETRSRDYDLTPFLNFALRGVAVQGGRMLAEIRVEMQKELFRNRMYDLFGRLKTRRKRVIGERQIAMLKMLLESGEMKHSEFLRRAFAEYRNLKSPRGQLSAISRDITSLLQLNAIEITQANEADPVFRVRLEWPTEITETEFFERIKTMPKGKTHPFLR